MRQSSITIWATSRSLWFVPIYIPMQQLEKIVSTKGHLIDSGLMRQIFDSVVSDGGSFEMLEFNIGRNNDEYSTARLKVTADDPSTLNAILLKLSTLGCQIDVDDQALLKPAPTDGVVPPDFYSTTNYKTEVRVNGDWLPVNKLRMDGVIVVYDGDDATRAEVKKFRDVKSGEKIACGLSGIRVLPDFVERERSAFAFMSNDVSSERKVRLLVERAAELISNKKNKVVAVAGPVVVHTGAALDLASLISNDYIHGLLAGNALAVHDIEATLYGTSLGVDLSSGHAVEMGHRNHLRAINEVCRAGSITNLVNEGKLESGVMQTVVRKEIPFSLAGSLRDDGPLPDTITDMNLAQEDHSRILEGADVVLMLSSMLHSIAVGNMIPAKVTTICVDINPAVVTKLKDRGSHQTLGIVTDVGLFLHLLADHLLKR